MQAEWFGQTFIRMQIKSPQNGDSNLLIDPYQTKSLGMRQPKMEADMVLSSEGKIDSKLNITGNPFVITAPGEYEVKQVFVYGIAEYDSEGTPTGKIMYVIEGENMTMAHLGNITQTELKDNQLEYLENVDVLFVPVGGGGSLEPKAAAKICQQIDPRVIVPLQYAFGGSKLPLAKVDEFIKVSGLTKPEKVEKLRLVKKDLPSEDTKLVIIEA